MKRHLILVSSGMVRPKKRDNLVARQYKYLNYGLLGLASILQQNGYVPEVVHGEFADPESCVQSLLTSEIVNDSLPLLLSIPSAFAIPWARRFCAELKSKHPGVLIVAGGRWVVGGDPKWLRSRIPELDLVVDGTAEDRIVDLMHPDRWTRIPGTHLLGNAQTESDTRLSNIDYSLLSNFKQYHPSIEVSRGCGMRCNFCAEAAVPLTPLKSPEAIVQEAFRSQRVYKNLNVNYYFEASIFRPTTIWIDKFTKQREAEFASFFWRCETRVDSLSPSSLHLLAAAGLRVVDLGLESASPQQLIAMNKTRRPAEYLRRAAELLRACGDAGVWTKVNILLYAGETLETIDQTLDWLERHRSLIKGLSVSPVIVYRPETRESKYLNALSQLGARLVDNNQLDLDGYGSLHLSRDIDAEYADYLSRSISRSFMTDRDFFELKSFSYFSPSFSYDEFLHAAANSDPESLPFRSS